MKKDQEKKLEFMASMAEKILPFVLFLDSPTQKLHKKHLEKFIHGTFLCHKDTEDDKIMIIFLDKKSMKEESLYVMALGIIIADDKYNIVGMQNINVMSESEKVFERFYDELVEYCKEMEEEETDNLTIHFEYGKD